MRLAGPLALLLLCGALAPTAAAQRRARVTGPLPIDAALLVGSSPYEYRLSVSARADVELTADVRLLHLEVRPAGARRALTCDSPTRPRRVDASTVRSLRAGQGWSETFDVRMLCWGRALAALEGGAEVRGSFGSARGVPAARAGSVEVHSAPIEAVTVSATALGVAPEGDVHVSLAPADAATGAHVSFRVTVRATRAIRAWVRPDRVRFRVRSPSGSTRTCAISRGVGAPIADLFARVSTRSGPILSLDAGTYCGADAFSEAGIYEVTPLLDLDVDGRRWRLDTPQGTFEGRSTAVRIRAGQPGARS